MKKYKFTAKIEPAGGGGAYILFPYDTEKEFGTKGRVPGRWLTSSSNAMELFEPSKCRRHLRHS
jgi:hypothetical protein